MAFYFSGNNGIVLEVSNDESDSVRAAPKGKKNCRDLQKDCPHLAEPLPWHRIRGALLLRVTCPDRMVTEQNDAWNADRGILCHTQAISSQKKKEKKEPVKAEHAEKPKFVKWLIGRKVSVGPPSFYSGKYITAQLGPM